MGFFGYGWDRMVELIWVFCQIGWGFIKGVINNAQQHNQDNWNGQ